MPRRLSKRLAGLALPLPTPRRAQARRKAHSMVGEVAKVPSHHDMDWGQFMAHWVKRHAPTVPTWDALPEKYPDDDAPIWWAVRNEHDRIHGGRGRRPGDPLICPVPSDHIHLPRVDPEIQRLLEELI